MTTAPLGLPLEYQQHPEWFDAHNVNASTEAKNAVIEGLLAEHNVHSVLDLTCGTGSQVFYLHQRGYDVTGADFSPALLTLARERAEEAGLEIPFIDGDMRSLHVGEFDAVITIFNAIGHLTREDFGVALKNIRRNLKTGGIYVFNIFNLAAISDELLESFAIKRNANVKGITPRNTQYSTLDCEQGLLTSHDHYLMDNNKELTNSFSLQIYTPEALDTLLAEHGFEVVKRCGFESEAFSREETVSMVTVAQRLT